MPMRTLRYAIVGSGMMGHEHLRNIALLRSSGLVDTQVNAIVDPDVGMRESAVALATSLGNADVQSFACHKALPFDQLDALVLVSPNHTHHAVLQDLLPTELPILAEKPLCTRIDHCEDLLQQTATRTAPFWVAMEYRYMPPTTRFLDSIRAGDIGQLRMLSIREHRYPFLDKVGHWNRFSANTGGTLVEKCCHHFDLMRLITGSEAVRVYASGNIDVNHLDERYAGRTPDILDNALVIVDFANGVRASLELCMFADGAEPQEQLTAIGDVGKLDAFIPGPDRFWPDAAERSAEVVLSLRDQTPQRREVITIDPQLAAAGDHHGSTYYQHQRFAAAVLEGGAVEVSVADGAAAVRIAAAAQESIDTGQAVTLATHTL